MIEIVCERFLLKEDPLNDLMKGVTFIGTDVRFKK